MRRTILLAAVLALAGLAQAQSADLKIRVVKEANGKPVRNASVVLHSLNDKGKQGTNGLQLKSDADGWAKYSGMSYGKLRIQVIAPGYRTFGEDFEISRPEQEISIKLQRPVEQHSIYSAGKKQ